MIEPHAHLIHALAQPIAADVDVDNVKHWQFASLGQRCSWLSNRCSRADENNPRTQLFLIQIVNGSALPVTECFIVGCKSKLKTGHLGGDTNC
jgi:hypothetical protein